MNQPPHDQSPLLIPIPGQAGQDDAVVVIATMYTSKVPLSKKKTQPLLCPAMKRRTKETLMYRLTMASKTQPSY